MMAVESIRRAGAVVSSAKGARIYLDAARTPKQSLKQRMKAEAEALDALHRKALALSRGASSAAAGNDDVRFSAPGPRSEAAFEAAAKRRKTTHSISGKAGYQVKEPSKQKPTGQRPASPSKDLMIKKAKEIIKAREIARAREKCRQEVLEIDRTVLPDETIYSQDLKELGIWDEYAVTRTWNQARCGGPR